LLFIILIPIINTINYHLTYSRIRWDWYTYTTYLIDTAQGYIAWWIIRKTILWLDRKMPYAEGPARRIALQLLLTNMVAQGFIIMATEAVNAVYTDNPLPINFYTYNLFIFFIWILVINGIYIAMYLHDQLRTSQDLREQDKKLRTLGFEVQLGNSVKNISFEDIAVIYVEEGTTSLKTLKGNTFILDRSLNKIMPVLPEELFFRLNRRYIAHRKAISGYHKGVNGKLQVRLHALEGMKETITVSRITAPEFKEWFRATVQLS
jgi:DNA-binding LytR/AlgR family response regulator